MSGFDFDALRDPNAPIPTERERAGVDARARQLHTRSRRNRLAASVTAIVAATAIVLGVVATQHDNEPAISVPGVSTTAPSPTTSSRSSADRFVPPTHRENGLEVVPVTLPDGKSLTLRYPPAMRIAGLGFVGEIAVSGREVTIRYGTIAHLFGDAKPTAVFRGANGERVRQLPIPSGPDAGKPASGSQLVFQFGPWVASVFDPNIAPGTGDLPQLTDAERATWARSLTGGLDPNGYLVLQVAAPLSIDNDFRGLFGTSADEDHLAISSSGSCHDSGTVTRHRFLNGDGSHSVEWCAGNDLHLSANGSAAFADLAAEKLQVSALTSPRGSATTTTTAPRLGAPSFALSATFISPDRGWVVEQNGVVAATTDGGATWHDVGAVGGPRSDWKIRFANSTHGFAYDGNGLLATTDGGVHWKLQRDTPFSSVSDLAIANGVAYVVGLPSFSTPVTQFHIWSTPVDTLDWSMDPLAIAPGAGPAPTQQLVFSGRSGWLLSVNRTVISGARLSPSGTWTAWTPPCLDVNGPAHLAASTATDLVASCDEGVWGPPQRASALYVSHNGGDSFERHVTTRYGTVASPDPSTALTFDGNTLQRTTDNGATWKFVAGLGDNVVGRPDIGFTTATQGFAALGDGELLMTHDAGATWQPVTLP